MPDKPSILGAIQEIAEARGPWKCPNCEGGDACILCRGSGILEVSKEVRKAFTLALTKFAEGIRVLRKEIECATAEVKKQDTDRNRKTQRALGTLEIYTLRHLPTNEQLVKALKED